MELTADQISMLVKMNESPDGTERPVPARPDVMESLESAGLIRKTGEPFYIFGPEYTIQCAGVKIAEAHIGERGSD